MSYQFAEIEKKWQKFWEDNNFYRAEDPTPCGKKVGQKMYILIEFPYPSGDGLHVGHCRSYVSLDAVARKKRMEGFNVLYPIGWDAFGLPTENYAIKTGIHPKVTTEKNIANFKRQLKSLGLSFDWTREINTTDSGYYKWTQWIFLQLFKRGLAYQAKIPINWCPSCKIGLANEEVIEGRCERCGEKVNQIERKQWMLKITQYADRLIEDLDTADYLEKIKLGQINWIGKSYGTEIDFKVVNSQDTIRVFTTRADTLFGVTAIVLAPEHPLTKKLVTEEHLSEVEEYIKTSREKSEFERTKLEKEKTGVFTGFYCLHPVSNEKIPIWVGDYVVATYGGGAVMVVPAHDYRDYDFAKKYGMEIREVVQPCPNSGDRGGGDISKPTHQKLSGRGLTDGDAFVDYGILINSGEFDGLSSQEAIKEITEWLENRGLGRRKVQYKLRDWIFSRQHYWGEPIPIIHCKSCGAVPVPEEDLPVELPFVEKYQPTGTGESPLANVEEWVNVKCPSCKGPARRETDTMPNWAGSNWYFMRYTDPNNKKALAHKKKLEYWMPVDWYNGGMEHTTLHLLYSRFIYKFLYDIGVAPTLEPYKKRTSHGMVLAEDGRKMSKSFNNVINPEEIIKTYGADTLRVYEMFMGPFDQAIAWSTQGVKGVFRFLERVWKLVLDCAQNQESSLEAIRAIHRLNKKIDYDLENAKFNTPIAAFMEFVNFGLANKKQVGRDVIKRMLLLLAPFAPHIAEELWERIGESPSIFTQSYPKYDEELTKEEKITIVVQINGKLRATVEVERDISDEELKRIALENPKIQKYVAGKNIKKSIIVPEKLVNFVVG